MKKILGLTIAAILVIALAGGGTWAYFSDTESSADNTLLAGTLDLGVANSGTTNPTTSVTATWTATTWKPTDTKSGTLYINNEGTIPITTLKVSFDYSPVDYSARPVNIDGSPWALDTDKFDKMIKATTATWDSVSVAAIAGKTLEELKAAGDITLTGGLAANTEKALAIIWTFDSTATNGCQGASVNVTVTATGTQN